MPHAVSSTREKSSEQTQGYSSHLTEDECAYKPKGNTLKDLKQRIRVSPCSSLKDHLGEVGEQMFQTVLHSSSVMSFVRPFHCTEVKVNKTSIYSTGLK
ncbi:hypothetical protein P7K49_014814 [Saguinus oedipus]|uniref:Uncharacterized protein n=1 Tax=Saguinus oedipus TaxID=9490 RepID=A0ABQ9V8A2_SAGOE|nr:hypothetical protein P7K49_014814 [Saguinus oedipus]